MTDCKQWSGHGCRTSKLHACPFSTCWLFSHNCELRLYLGKKKCLVKYFSTENKFPLLGNDRVICCQVNKPFINSILAQSRHSLLRIEDLCTSKGAGAIFGSYNAVWSLRLVVPSHINLKCIICYHRHGQGFFHGIPSFSENWLHFWRYIYKIISRRVNDQRNGITSFINTLSQAFGMWYLPSLEWRSTEDGSATPLFGERLQ